MGERLANSPLIEAICEFRFADATGWTDTAPDAFAERLGAEFSERTQSPSYNVQFAPNERPRVLEDAPLHRFTKKNGDAMFQVGPQILAVNHLRPYESWEVFRAFIERILRARNDLLGRASIARIGLRYINRIPIASAGLRIRDVLSVRPDYILDRRLGGFFQRYDFLEQDRPTERFVHQTGTVPGDEGAIALLLDLDFGSTAPRVSDDSRDILAWLEYAHDRIEREFVASLVPAFYAGLKEERAQ